MVGVRDRGETIREFGILHIGIKVVYTFRRRFLGQTYRGFGKK